MLKNEEIALQQHPKFVNFFVNYLFPKNKTKQKSESDRT